MHAFNRQLYTTQHMWELVTDFILDTMPCFGTEISLPIIAVVYLSRQQSPGAALSQIKATSCPSVIKMAPSKSLIARKLAREPSFAQPELNFHPHPHPYLQFFFSRLHALQELTSQSSRRKMGERGRRENDERGGQRAFPPSFPVYG